MACVYMDVQHIDRIRVVKSGVVVGRVRASVGEGASSVTSRIFRLTIDFGFFLLPKYTMEEEILEARNQKAVFFSKKGKNVKIA